MKGRSSILVRIARRCQDFPLWLFRFLEWPFLTGRPREDRNTQAIFIFALPRGGSTLTYQVLCHGLSVNYLSNFWHLLYQLPLLGGWFSSYLARKHHSDFQSKLGFVAGLDGPAEGLRFWRYWLDCGLSDKECETQAARKQKSRRSYLLRVISVLSRRSGPFLTAYLGHTLVPDRVIKTFPGAVVVRLRRDPVSNALSILESMRAKNIEWLSLKPSECESVCSSNEHEKVASQVYWLNRRLDDALSANEIIDVSYESVCDRPAVELRRVHDWCLKKGVQVDYKFSLPEQFSYRKVNLEKNDDAIKIQRELKKLEAIYGEIGEKS